MQMRQINKLRESMWCIHVLFTQTCLDPQCTEFWTDTLGTKFSSPPVREEINTVTTCSVTENDQCEASFSHLGYSEGLSPENDLSRPLSSILHVSVTPPWLSSSFPSLRMRTQLTLPRLLRNSCRVFSHGLLINKCYNSSVENSLITRRCLTYFGCML